MLIGLCGGICSGKSTIADYLMTHHSFKRLYLRSTTLPENTSDLSKISKDKTEYTFDASDDLLLFVTKRWREKWVTTDIHNQNILESFLRRPFFILISVDAPICLRWNRWKARQKQNSEKDLTLEEFLMKSDQHLYGLGSDSGQSLISRATVRLLNTSSCLDQLYATLGKLDLMNQERLRPSWDQYFMQLASLAAQRSNCMKRRVGCVVVREKRVISTGYNGTPRGLRNCGDGGCPRCNEGQLSGIGLGTCLCIHAEENALLEAGRERIREGSILYCDTCPCLTCSIKITQVGISEVVYSQSYSMDEETANVFKEAGIRFRRFVPPPSGTIRLEEINCP
ncbi:Deoxycytidylate deaminase [Erysiphe necator]|uniref:Deoxycytidylate deaminase n=1 Tax=Uncinula necator TaxID=52586 RepID=A0A0B1P469_UNCNE|nr:Deoxycytidylate deaminase [Erysiphe necator]KHJ31711.1 putative deoxycytidylate deaminase protein [Erysiphe necator]